MARPRRGDGKTHLHLHTDKGYRYAVSRDPVAGTDGKRSYTMVVWGTLDGHLRFNPNSRYLYAKDQWDRFVFPSDWDLSETERLRNALKPGRPSHEGDGESRLYGSVWFLTKVAERIGLSSDLMKVFGGDRAMVDDVLTLAFYPVLSRRCLDSLHVWQRIERMPTHARLLYPEDVTALSEKITEEQRMQLFRLRMARIGKDEILAVDSTSKSTYGSVLADIRWGRNKERLPLPQTNEVVAYGLGSHFPVYEKQLPGNIPDGRTVREIYTELRHAGFGRFTLLTDRGYATESVLDLLLGYGNPFVMGAKVGVRRILDLIGRVESGELPMVVDERSGCYCVQVPARHFVRDGKGEPKEISGLKVNLYLDDVMRASQKRDLAVVLQRQETELERMASEKETVEDAARLRSEFPLFMIVLDGDGCVASFHRDDRKIASRVRTCGYFASCSYKVDGDAKRMYALYKMRDEQEKYFAEMKGLADSGRNRAWNELSHCGRAFLTFVALSVLSPIKGTWSEKGLDRTFPTVMQMIDEMKSIRCVEHAGRAEYISPFVGKQLLVCQAFGLDVPDGCGPDEPKRFDSTTGKKRRGRPPKRPVTPSVS